MAEACIPKVLVVDDREENLFAMKKVLKDLPIEVITAQSGNDALRQMLHHQFAVVLLDVQMPDMDGLETAALMRENEDTEQVPIIFVSAFSKDDKVVFLGYDAGAVDYLFKPVDPPILIAKVRVFVELYQRKRELAGAHEELKRHVAERERMEQELRLRQKLEAVGQLAAGIAHEINTPIQYVGDNLYFLKDSLSDLQALVESYRGTIAGLAGQPEHQDLVAKIRAKEEASDLDYLMEHLPKAIARSFDGIERVASIVQAMREFAHPAQRAMAAADLNQALKNTLTVAHNTYKLVAEVETAFGEIPPVICHIGDLNQVFLNLIVNAAHAIGDLHSRDGQKGTIGVRTERVGESVRVSISDSGVGIDPEIVERIFDPFFTTKEVGRGTGQGLAIARNIIVDRHQGELSFETTPGEGTTFHMLLPIGGSESADEWEAGAEEGFLEGTPAASGVADGELESAERIMQG